MDHSAPETVFSWSAPPLRFGAGASDELGQDLFQLGLQRILIVTDFGVAATGLPERIRVDLAGQGIAAEVYDGAQVEPSDLSLAQAGEVARSKTWDGLVAIGGGSAIDTAKAMNLLGCCPGELLDYTSPPYGMGRIPEAPLKPLIAVATTTGGGSECTSVCLFDLPASRIKAVLDHPALRPSLAVVDPLTTLTLPPAVAASTGLDALLHALEAFTARPYTSFKRPSPYQRTESAGANPISDTWAERALRLIAGSLRAAALGHSDPGPRLDLMLAGTLAGMAQSSAGGHLPHACAQPIAAMVRDFRPDGYPAVAGPLVPHGLAAALTAPAAFRFTFPADPHRHLAAARIIDPDQGRIDDARDRLPFALVTLMRDLGMPNGLAAVGYSERDVVELTDGAMEQERLISLCPRRVTHEDIGGIFSASMENWWAQPYWHTNRTR